MTDVTLEQATALYLGKRVHITKTHTPKFSRGKVGNVYLEEEMYVTEVKIIPAGVQLTGTVTKRINGREEPTIVISKRTKVEVLK